MSFDRLAAHYRWMEWLLAGRKLQRCRTAFLPARLKCHVKSYYWARAMVVFLVALLTAHPRTHVTCVDASAAMLQRARARATAAGCDLSTVSFVHADILVWTPPSVRFDLIVSHFFLDCFTVEQIHQIVGKIAPAAAVGAHWLVADFCEPAAGLARWRAQIILRSLYLFFRRVTGLYRSRITPPSAYFPSHGFELRERVLFEWGLLHSDRWSLDPGSELARA